MNYFVYIKTNPSKTTFYTGVTNDLYTRMKQHYENRGNPKTFAGRYYCYNLLFWERFESPSYAIEREKGIKGWTRQKKLNLIKSMNPSMGFLNKSI